MDSEAHEASARNVGVETWMAALAQSHGSPGGGAASGVMLAIAAALTSMVAGYTEPSPERDRILERAREHRLAALALADEDASASNSFGGAYRLPAGPERDESVRAASIQGARAAAALGERAVELLPDLEWLAANGNRALIADAAVALGALRAAISGCRVNLSFDLGALEHLGDTLEQVRLGHPALFATVTLFDQVLSRIDDLSRSIDDRAAPTD
ncbi:cyclodeaminase/cyclohydrolase family protein [Herbiconiux daphne]|uniref:Cyclodeaminase/cyclohydrolase family protein n=1 Tax=Herbiconiux daphne TaxID=2970914 RepID=A0ABT2H424_9MICO|nr:cyclodeaminase/cyclohydrolase family protein [Herbiconiux daphne]MCS5734684.1 cyclodeaminase/cyclohydrolase family protein [Herbiconiux daphne]